MYRNIIKALDFIYEKNGDNYKKVNFMEDISESLEAYKIKRNLTTCESYIRDIKQDVGILYKTLCDRIEDLENENAKLKNQ